MPWWTPSSSLCSSWDSWESTWDGVWHAHHFYRTNAAMLCWPVYKHTAMSFLQQGTPSALHCTAKMDRDWSWSLRSTHDVLKWDDHQSCIQCGQVRGATIEGPSECSALRRWDLRHRSWIHHSQAGTAAPRMSKIWLRNCQGNCHGITA